ncbi:glycosyltransferase family protein [Marinobacterium sediminicola]|nr:glycosyltransferase [Marinobacterium sediminicola]ULG68387.1 glycosyltransferase [Marinobacterium sediminicola]
MSLSVGITINSISYTPEAYAYSNYLKSKGLDVQLAESHLLDPLHDVHIYFMGLLPFWKKKGAWREIHEYQSLSTPPFARTKDFTKKILNRKPDGRIFLNQLVHNQLGFRGEAPFIYRDMGVDDALFQKPSENPLYDIVYCGSIGGRVGLLDELKRLSELGFKVLMIGSVDNGVRQDFSGNKNIFFTGRVERKDLPELYRNCRAGLNYTPDIYPFNIQTSTKTLEYLASGLSIISNKYQWAEDFFLENNISVTWLDCIRNVKDLKINNSNHTSLSDEVSWSAILDKSRFYEFILNS